MRNPRAITTRSATLLLSLGLWCACSNEPGFPQPPVVQADSGQDPEVMAVLQRALLNLRAAPEDLALRSEYAMLLDANGLDQSAQQAWQQLLELDPSNARAWYYLSKVSERNADGETCYRAMLKCAQLAPEYAAAQSRLGRLLMERGEGDAAEQAFRRSAQLDPASPRGPLGLARLFLARGDGAAAIEMLTPVLARNPREPYAHALLARAYILNGDAAKAELHLAAEEQAGAATGADPWNADLKQRATGMTTRIARAKAALGRGDAQAALDQMQPLWGRRHAEQAVVETLCEIRMLMGQPEKVLALLGETQGGFAQAYSLLLYQARAERALGEEQHALSAAQKAAALNPRRMEAPAFSGQILFVLERYPEAVAALLKARENGDDSLQSLAFLGRARGQSGDIKTGIADLTQATERYPSVPKPWAYRAELLAMDGRHTEAAQSLERAISLGLSADFQKRYSDRLQQLKSKVH